MNNQESTQSAVTDFERDGYMVIREFMTQDEVASLIECVDDALNPPLAPIEFEADVHYPGSPASRTAPGGATPRRILNAYSRYDIFRACAKNPRIVTLLQQIMGSDQILLSQNHHNCVMTKHPGFSSVTSWHQDIRYWSFDRPELVSTWLALGQEREENGSLFVIPGSHRLNLDRGRLDAALFLRTDLEENRALLEQAQPVELEAGDLLIFHSRTFHAAGQNQTQQIKRSLVYTYRTDSNEPIPETRSAVYPDIPVSQPVSQQASQPDS